MTWFLEAALLVLCAESSLLGSPPANRVPFVWTPGQIEVAVHTNGVPATFLLDTGSEYSVVSSRLVVDLKLATRRSGQREFADDVTLQIGSVTVEHQRVMVLPFDTFYARGRHIDGLIGYDVFTRFAIEIDFEQRRLMFWAAETYQAPRSSLVLPIEFVGRLPAVQATLKLSDGRRLSARLLVDTGAQPEMILRYPFSTAHGLLNLAGRGARTATSPSLAYGDMTTVEIPVDEVVLAGWVFSRPTVRAFREPAGSGGFRETDGLIGNTLLSRFRVTVDFPHKRLLLDPVKR